MRIGVINRAARPFFLGVGVGIHQKTPLFSSVLAVFIRSDANTATKKQKNAHYAHGCPCKALLLDTPNFRCILLLYYFTFRCIYYYYIIIFAYYIIILYFYYTIFSLYYDFMFTQIHIKYLFIACSAF